MTPSCWGGGPAGIAAAAGAAQNGARTLLAERYGFLDGMGTAAGVTNFCGLFANVHGEIRRVVHGVADDLLDRIERLGGLNAPHPVFGRTMAQAYDMSAYKCAADDLLAAAGDRHHLLGLAAITLVLGITYWLMRERDDRMALASGSARPVPATHALIRRHRR
jgi:hypothetical protein